MKQGGQPPLSLIRMTKRILTLFICIIVSCTACKENQAQPVPVPRSTEASQHIRSKSAQPSQTGPAEKPILKPPVQPFLPNRLAIPAIGITAEIEPVTTLPDGQMGVPADIRKAGISYPGILPGAPGNVLLDGHVDSYTGPAVFFDLKKLKPGNSIIVSNLNGPKLIYVVESVEIYFTHEAPLGRIFGPTTEHRLTLITCTGRYSRKKKEHEKRLIVFARQEGER